MKLGAFDIDVVSDGTFRLDGGAMFGIVPKVAWEKSCPADDKNRILLGLNCLLVRTGAKTYLVDTGIGDKHDVKWAEMYDVRRPTPLLDRLRALGVSPETIDGVILSHLHFDHAGGATTRDRKPAFPRATYYVQLGMWAEALEANPRTKGSYRPDDFVPLETQARVSLLKGDEEIAPGIRVKLTGGHVKHHQSIFIESGGSTAVFWGDLVPTTHHLKPAWVMGYDLYPADVAAMKGPLLAQSAREGWLNIFEHDPAVPMATIHEDGRGGFRAEPLVSLGTS